MPSVSGKQAANLTQRSNASTCGHAPSSRRPSNFARRGRLVESNNSELAGQSRGRGLHEVRSIAGRLGTAPAIRSGCAAAVRAVWTSSVGGEPERKHRAWFLDRQRRLVLRGGGVALPAVPCRRALKIHRTPPRRARLARPSSRQPATPSENLVRHPPSGQRPKASTSTRPELPYVELRAPPRRRPRRQYGDGSMSAASWNTSQTILDPGNRAAETWTAGRGGPCRQWRRLGRTAGWTVFRLPSGVDGK